jgi:hypothetical protein
MDIKRWLVYSSSDSTNNHVITALGHIFPIQLLSMLFKTIRFPTKEIYGIFERVISGLIEAWGTKGLRSHGAFPAK